MSHSRRKHRGPSSGAWRYHVARLYMKVLGWKVEGQLPDTAKGVVIAAPHTSSWDLPHMIAVAWMFDLNLSWIGKHTLFQGKTGAFMRWLGGIPVDRRARHGAVAQVVEHFDVSEALLLAIAPSGTRAHSACWKSGFYHMAVGARVPIICSFLDYDRKVGGVGLSFVPSGDIKADMNRLRAFYGPIGAKYPERVSTIRLRDENAAVSVTVADEPAAGQGDHAAATVPAVGVAV